MSNWCKPLLLLLNSLYNEEEEEEYNDPLLCLDILGDKWFISYQPENEIVDLDHLQSSLSQLFPHSIIKKLEGDGEEQNAFKFSLHLPYKTSIEEIYLRLSELDQFNILVELE
jgi:hypothetical protein